jgi:hypothetical protein
MFHRRRLTLTLGAQVNPGAGRRVKGAVRPSQAGEHFHVGLIAIADPYRRLALPQVF